MMKTKDMNRDQLRALAQERQLSGRSKLNAGELAQALIAQEECSRMNRFPGQQLLTPKQARRVRQKMNRQK